MLPGSPECSVNFVHAQQNTRGREGRGDGRLSEHGHPAGTQLTIRLPYNLLATCILPRVGFQQHVTHTRHPQDTTLLFKPLQRQNSKTIARIRVENWLPNSPRLDEIDIKTPWSLFLFLFLLVVSCGKRSTIEMRSKLVLS